ncbi:hypothetical protein KPL74_00260 [Bacillus sp. NP157]|nr:hypothetical protein KPL74_00260 [Bacillus sp. NP157]
MFNTTGRSLMLAAALAQCCLVAYPGVASAQRWADHHDGWRSDRQQRDHDQWERDRERKRRSDAKRDGVVAGVVGTAVVVGIIAAVANAKKDNRPDECRDDYGNVYRCR